MDLKTVIDSAPTLKKPRRTFTAEFKHQLIQQCQQLDASVANVAMQHQINANLLHKWIRQSESMPPPLKSLPKPFCIVSSLNVRSLICSIRFLMNNFFVKNK